jgi:ApaG protein
VSSSEATTRGIRVRVQSSYVRERSQPDQNQWFFLYTVRITNEGTETAQLISRHWIITDANGEIQEVKGPGVVGKQPVIEPGAEFEYTSFCPLPTPFGTMRGSYQMVTTVGARFDAEIAPFSIAEPNAVN